MTGRHADLIGYSGAGLIVIAYLLNQAGHLRSADWRFPTVNLAGSLLITVSLLFHPNLPSIAIEAFWIVISLYGLQRSLRRPN